LLAIQMINAVKRLGNETGSGDLTVFRNLQIDLAILYLIGIIYVGISFVLQILIPLHFKLALRI
jgi:hypothetical protein